MASALEQFVNNVRQLSAQGQMTQLCELINKSGELLAKNLSHLDTVLGALDVQEHSLGVLAVLFVKFSMPNIPDFETLFSQVQLFISTCNGEHIRYATDTFAGLCHQLTNALVEKKQLCLLAKCFKPALPYLELDMMDICKENGAYDARHFLCYYYYGGMIYTGLKNFERALYFYEQAITTPAMAVSHIMLEAYKKYILVSLILHGKVQPLPKYTSQIVGRFIKPLSNAYHDLAQVYTTNNPAELRNVVNKHNESFAKDNNMGLVKQCLSSLYKKNIQRLTKPADLEFLLQTFLTLSLQDMASRVQLSGAQEAEKYVLHMIEDGEIYASINQKDGMVSFHDNPEKYNNPAMLHNIDQEAKSLKCTKAAGTFYDELLRRCIPCSQLCGQHPTQCRALCQGRAAGGTPLRQLVGSKVAKPMAVEEHQLLVASLLGMGLGVLIFSLSIAVVMLWRLSRRAAPRKETARQPPEGPPTGVVTEDGHSWRSPGSDLRAPAARGGPGNPSPSLPCAPPVGEPCTRPSAQSHPCKVTYPRLRDRRKGTAGILNLGTWCFCGQRAHQGSSARIVPHVAKSGQQLSVVLFIKDV
ncbi:CSN3 protein, partial [Polypterus senegalus]